MSTRVKQWFVAALAVVVLALVAILAVRANAEQSVEIDEAALARAKALHERASRSERPAASPQRERPTPKRPARPARSPRKRPNIDTADDDLWQRAKGPGIPQPEPRLVDKKVTLTPGTETFVLAMDAANKLYDRGDYLGALEAAEELLAQQPKNVRMLRIAVSCHCLLGNADDATELWGRLPSRDQRQMAARCERSGIEFEQEAE